MMSIFCLLFPSDKTRGWVKICMYIHTTLYQFCFRWYFLFIIMERYMHMNKKNILKTFLFCVFFLSLILNLLFINEQHSPLTVNLDISKKYETFLIEHKKETIPNGSGQSNNQHCLVKDEERSNLFHTVNIIRD